MWAAVLPVTNHQSYFHTNRMSIKRFGPEHHQLNLQSVSFNVCHPVIGIFIAYTV